MVVARAGYEAKRVNAVKIIDNLIRKKLILPRDISLYLLFNTFRLLY